MPLVEQPAYAHQLINRWLGSFKNKTIRLVNTSWQRATDKLIPLVSGRDISEMKGGRVCVRLSVCEPVLSALLPAPLS